MAAFHWKSLLTAQLKLFFMAVKMIFSELQYDRWYPNRFYKIWRITREFDLISRRISDHIALSEMGRHERPYYNSNTLIRNGRGLKQNTKPNERGKKWLFSAVKMPSVIIHGTYWQPSVIISLYKIIKLRKKTINTRKSKSV